MITARLTNLNLIKYSSLWPLPLMKLRSNVSAIWSVVFLLCWDITLCSALFYLGILCFGGSFLSKLWNYKKKCNMSSLKCCVPPKSWIPFGDWPVSLKGSIGTGLVPRGKVWSGPRYLEWNQSFSPLPILFNTVCFSVFSLILVCLKVSRLGWLKETTEHPESP